MKGFINFIREQGVVGLAGNLEEAILVVGPIKILWGDFVASLIDFLVIAVVVYFGFKILKLIKLDKKKDEPYSK